MGLNPSGDEFCAKTDQCFEGLDLEKIVDDILLQADTMQELLHKLYAVLLRCREHNLTLSRSKLEVGTSVKFAGYMIAADGIRPDPEKTRALSDFPAPTDVSQLRSFLGLANQLGVFVPDLTHMSDPLRPLLRKNAVYIWDPVHQAAFDDMKRMLVSGLVVGPFDPNLQTELLTDASRLKGFGFALIQRTPTSLRLVQCGSRSLTSPETRYATIELECLAVQWAVKACRHYLLGLSSFRILTDHKPLVGIFAKHLNELNNDRLLRFREKLTQYTFDVVWVQGKTHFIADALSRAPVFSPPEEAQMAQNVNVAGFVISAAISSIDPMIQELASEAERDEDYKVLLTALLGCNKFSLLPPIHPARLFQNVWDELSVFEDKLVMLGNRLVIPQVSRRRILSLLHASHSGILRTRKLAQSLYYWPGMMSDIKSMVDACSKCQMFRQSQAAEPLQLYPPSPSPMFFVSVDLFQVGNVHFLVMVDRFSGYPFVARLTGLGTTAITTRLLAWFHDYGFPHSVLSDNGPQFRSEFNEFCSSFGILHTLSSAYHAQSNGLAESCVKSMKHLLQKLPSFSDFPAALMSWRNVPRTVGSASPSELFFGRSQRTLLPRFDPSDFPARPEVVPGRTSLSVLSSGDIVLVQDAHTKLWDREGVILSRRESDRSYEVSIAGTTYLRNRIFLKFLRKSLLNPVTAPFVQPEVVTDVPLRRSSRIRAQVDAESTSSSSVVSQTVVKSDFRPVCSMSARSLVSGNLSLASSSVGHSGCAFSSAPVDQIQVRNGPGQVQRTGGYRYGSHSGCLHDDGGLSRFRTAPVLGGGRRHGGGRPSGRGRVSLHDMAVHLPPPPPVDGLGQLGRVGSELCHNAATRGLSFGTRCVRLGEIGCLPGTRSSTTRGAKMWS